MEIIKLNNKSFSSLSSLVYSLFLLHKRHYHYRVLLCVKHVGCDMMLGSEAREDSCRECGGDGRDCNTVTGLFDTDDLQVGMSRRTPLASSIPNYIHYTISHYNSPSLAAGYIDILLIPQGATNIVVKEVSPSNNYLGIYNNPLFRPIIIVITFFFFNSAQMKIFIYFFHSEEITIL